MVTFLVTLFILLTGNQRFFLNLSSTLQHDVWLKYKMIVVMGGIVFSLIYLLFSIFSFKRVIKPMLIAMLLVSALASYFMDTYQIVIDDEMLRNALETDMAEATELLSIKMLLYIVLLGLLPALLIFFIKFRNYSFRAYHLRQLGAVLLALIMLISFIGVFFKDVSIIGSEHRDLRYYTNPTYPLYSLIKYLDWNKGNPAMANIITPVGLDAHRAMTTQQRGKKTLVVFVLGETARASAFSYAGYPRNTNRYTQNKDMIFFDQVTSCGTSTAQSVPCMFSDLVHDDYDVDDARARENVLDVLHHAGVEVLWRDNNSGCKGMCDRVQFEDLSHLKLSDICHDGECFDEVLLHGIQPRLDKADDDMLVVLHQKGSHGPAYFKRYPEKFAIFQPECRTSQVEECNQASIVNSYDNTIVYTDYFLSRVVDLLKHNADRFNVALIYVSDHGESLGENGIYLHGLPYAIAPSSQTHVPMMVWMSDGYAKGYDVDISCVSQQHAHAYSHDNLFHNLLGMFDVRSSVYRADMDILANCHRPYSVTVDANKQIQGAT
jgi:lipid A ethanolaminephosphotransferase